MLGEAQGTAGGQPAQAARAGDDGAQLAQTLDAFSP
jgi:hypothetical protein